MAKEATQFQIPTRLLALSPEEIKPVLKQYLLPIWQLQWDTTEIALFYKTLVPTVSYSIQFSDSNRAMESILTKLRFNHNKLNANRYKIGCADSPLCDTCRTPETLEHYLFDCMQYLDFQDDLRQEFFQRKLSLTVSDMLGGNRVASILTYEYILNTNIFFIPH